MDENEDLWVIETDQGDGWTRVRRIKPTPVDPMPEGFVPTSYIETTELFAVPHPVQKCKEKMIPAQPFAIITIHFDFLDFYLSCLIIAVS